LPPAGSGMKHRSLTLFALASLLAACGRADGTQPAASGEPRYVKAHSLQQLMDTVIEPDAQVFWHSSGTVSDTGGAHDLTPTTAAGWTAAQSSAATVAEMGNVLMTPLYARERGPDWIEFARTQVQVGKEAEQAARARDGDAMFVAGARLADACSACHQAYLPQEQAARADSPQ
jgi:hypothetical protein